MYEAYLAYLDNKDLLDPSASKAFDAVKKLTTKKLIDLVYESEEFLPLPDPKPATRYDFYANESMSGGRGSCTMPACRLKRLHETAVFAALYSDCVWIPSPIGCVVNRMGTLGFLKRELLTALIFLNHLRPMLEAGVIKLAPRRSENYCMECFSAVIGMSPKTYLRRTKESRAFLTKTFAEKVTYKAYKIKDHYTVLPASQSFNDLLGEEHFSYNYYADEDEDDWAHLGLTKDPRILSVAEVKEAGIGDLYAQGILFDVFHQNYFAAQYGTSYLTSRPIDLTLISRISPLKSKIPNKRVTSGLSHNVPSGIDLKLSEIIRLRQAERGLFLQYRSAVSKAIQEVQGTSIDKTKDIFFDLINPEVNRLDVLVSQARKTSKSNLVQDLATPSAYIGLGLFSGLISSTTAATLAGLVGGYHLADKLVTRTRDMLSDPKEVKGDKFYWLWKVNQTAK